VDYKSRSEEQYLIKQQRGALKVALVYPNSYYLGMSSLGLQIIYYELNKDWNAFCERCFLPDQKNQEELLQKNKMIGSYESNIPLKEFDLIAFSVSFEADYFNIPKILQLAQIPYLADERDGRNSPIVIAGGISVSYNPEPIADFIDAFVIGEAELLLHQFLDKFYDWKYSKAEKNELLKELDKIDSVYVPSFFDVEYQSDGTIKSNNSLDSSFVNRAIIDNIDKVRGASAILTPDTEFSDVFLVEIARGCIWNCRFCVLKHVRCPYRTRSLESVIKLAKEAIGFTDRVGLIGASVSDHPQIDEIASRLLKLGFKISTASLRAETVSKTLLDAIAESEQSTITIAPEVATKRLQEKINKTVPEEKLFFVIEEALKRGLFNIRLYFMVGVPDETQEDIEAIIDICKKIREIFLKYAQNKGIMPQLNLTVSPLIPKPHTPFERIAMDSRKSISQKLKYLQKQFGKIGGISMSSASARLSHMEAVLSRGDRRLGKVIANVAIKSISWKQALRKYGLSSEFYTIRERPDDEILPWEFIQIR